MQKKKKLGVSVVVSEIKRMEYYHDLKIWRT